MMLLNSYDKKTIIEFITRLLVIITNNNPSVDITCLILDLESHEMINLGQKTDDDTLTMLLGGMQGILEKQNLCIEGRTIDLLKSLTTVIQTRYE